MRAIEKVNGRRKVTAYILMLSLCLLAAGWPGAAAPRGTVENQAVQGRSAINHFIGGPLAAVPVKALRSTLRRSGGQWQALVRPIKPGKLAGARATAANSSGVQALFELSKDFSAHQGEPYPTDLLMVPDSSQNTGKQLVLTFPFELDGFPVQPRLSIPFSGPIEPNTVSSKNVFLVSLGSTLPGGPQPGQIIGINQVVWEVAANTLHAESNDLLDQHSQYALVVTNGIRDTNGNPVQASGAFTNFHHDLLGQQSDPALKAYGQELATGLGEALDASGIPAKSVVTASVFTTRSVTATLEKIRDQIKAGTPAPADFLIGPGGTRALFNLSDVALCPGPYPTCGVTFNLQFGDNAADPASFVAIDTVLELGPLFGFPVGQVAYGRFSSPNYINSDVVLTPVASRTGVPAVLGTNSIYFTLVLPSGPKPPHGWPVVIYGHGSGEGKDLAASDISFIMATQGIATIVINAAGFGWGPASTVSITRNNGTVVTIPAPGRGSDLDGDGFITAGDGAFGIGPLAAFNRDSNQQTAADWMQLVREIQVGMDVDGDGQPDLDASRIYHVGLSLGGIEGTPFDAVEPNVHAAVINSTGSPFIDSLRLSPFPNTLATYALILGFNSLLNGPGGTFIDDTPLRNQPPVIDNVPGASAIQDFNDAVAWLMSPGEPVPYAQHLRKEPLAGVGSKSVIIQYAKGDKLQPNPLETALVRAGGLADRTTFFRNDLFDLIDPAAAVGGVSGQFPHIFLVDFFDDGNTAEVANDTQQQIALFLGSNGTNIVSPQTIDPGLPAGLFEVPIVTPVPEDLNYLF